LSDEPVRIDWDASVPFTWAVVVLIAAVHVATASVEAWLGKEGLVAGLLFEREVWFRVAVGGKHAARLGGEPWRVATSVLLHGNAVHLVVNALALGALGRVLEPWTGGPRLVAWFVAGGLLGSAASVLAGVRMSDGASGGAFALLGAAVVLGWRVRGRLDAEDRRVTGPVLGGFLALNLALSLALPFVDAAAHLGGLAAGVALGLTADVAGAPPWRGGPAARAVEIALIAAFAATCAIGWA